MKVGVVGYYGKFNTGDDAMAAVCLTELSRRMPQARLFVPSQPLALPEGVDVRWQPLARPWQPGFARERRLCEGHCDALVFGGGSVFSDVKGTHALELRHRRIKTLRARGTRVVALGVGLGPLTTKEGKSAARDLFQLFDAIVVRDEASLRLAADLELRNVSLGFDVAVLLEEIGLPQPVATKPDHGDKKTLGISICDYSQYVGRGSDADTLRLKKIVAGLRAHDWAGWRLKLLVLNGHPRVGDLKVAARCQAALKNSVECELALYHPNPLQMLRHVDSCDAVISMRLHGAVYAYVAGRPFAVLSYHSKCEDFAEMVNLPKSQVIDSETFVPEDLGRMIARLMTMRAGHEGLMPLQEARALAREGLDRVFEVVCGGGG